MTGATDDFPGTTDDFRRRIKSSIRDAVKLKKAMIKKNLRRAKAKCPECEGHIQGALVGRRDHMRFWCDGTCNRQLME